MNAKLAIKNCRWPLLLVAAFPLVAQSGCVKRNNGVLVQQQRAYAMLATARAQHLTLFGDLPHTGRQMYWNRPVVSAVEHTFSEVGTDFDADIDRAGERMIFSSTRHSMQPDLYIKNINGVALTQLTSDGAADVHPAFSPDGRRVAFASDRGGSWDIWAMDVNGGPPMQVTRGPADEVHPSWSPDGTRVVYCSLPANGGQWELWITDAGSNGLSQFIGYGLFPEWSPKGDQIVYQRARERGSRWFSIWSLTLSNGEPSYPTELAGDATQAMILPTWSPDGSRIAFVSTSGASFSASPTVPMAMGQVFDVWVMDVDGRHRVRLTDGYTTNFAPAFGPNNRVYFTSNRSGSENIWSLRAPTMSWPGQGQTARQNRTFTPPATRTGSYAGGL